MSATEQRPVLVGVDGSEESLNAVRWAAAGARLRGRPLRLVNTFIGPLLTAPLVAPPYDWLPDNLREEADTLVRQAAEVARSLAPDVPVTGDVVSGPPGRLLVEMSYDAHLVAVGHRGFGGFATLLLGSVASTVAAHAHCPVVVVRSQPPGAGPVVVGVDGSEPSGAALEFAFEEADLRGVPLHAVHAWQPPSPPWRAGLRYDADEIETAQRHQLYGWLQPAKDKHPHVPVEHHLVAGDPPTVLIEAARDASLLVIGSRGRGGLTGMVLGSVSQQVVHHAGGAVAVIH
jgi:nucleotide-binding universal stress UspA family protein